MDALETTYRIEPCHLEQVPTEVADLIGELIAATARLGGWLHRDTAASLRDLVALMNCYYSNLIEGHNTRPRDIERALMQDLDEDAERRDLQLEARAHVRVQATLDSLHREGKLGEPAAAEFIRSLQRQFYEGAPPSLLRITTR